MYVCTYVLMYVWTCVRICTYGLVYVCMYVGMYVRMYICTYVRMDLCTYMYVWTYVHVLCIYAKRLAKIPTWSLPKGIETPNISDRVENEHPCASRYRVMAS